MSIELSHSDIQSIREAISCGWDKTTLEIGSALRSAGFNIADEQAAQIVKKLAIPPDALLTEEIMQSAAREIPKQQQAATLFAEAFKPLDKYGDGTVTITDLRLVLGNMGDLKVDEIDEIVEEVDPDAIGRVYIDNFLQVFTTKI